MRAIIAYLLHDLYLWCTKFLVTSKQDSACLFNTPGSIGNIPGMLWAEKLRRSTVSQELINLVDKYLILGGFEQGTIQLLAKQQNDPLIWRK